MKKVLYIHNVDVTGHTANLTQVISMCNAFKLNNLNVLLLLPLPKKENAFQTELKLRETYGIDEVIKISFFKNPFAKNKIRKFTHHFFLKKHINKFNPDFCYTRDVNFLSACVKAKKKTIYESHNFKIHNGSEKINKYLFKKLLKISKSEYYLFMVTISDMLRKHWISKGFDEKKIQTLHDGFIEEKYKNEISKLEARKALQLPLDKELAIYTGNLYPNRGVNIVLNLAKEFKEITFIVVGGPEKFKKELVKNSLDLKLENIHFLGQVAFSKIHLYQFAADINLGIWSKDVPTINYCSPLKIFEYMAVGRIIVAMGFPSIKEVLINNKNAFVSNPEKQDSFTKKFKEAITNKTKGNELAFNARKESFQSYTWKSRAKKIISKL